MDEKKKKNKTREEIEAENRKWLGILRVILVVLFGCQAIVLIFHTLLTLCNKIALYFMWLESS